MPVRSTVTISRGSRVIPSFVPTMEIRLTRFSGCSSGIPVISTSLENASWSRSLSSDLRLSTQERKAITSASPLRLVFEMDSLHFFSRTLVDVGRIAVMRKFTKSILGLLVCLDLFITNATALMRHSVDEFLVEDQRTRMTKKNNHFVSQRVLDNNMLGDNLGVAFAVASFEPDASSDDLPPLIVDYANMIRNDIMFMDDEVRRTGKRDSTVVGNKDQTLPETLCSCEISKEPIDLGKEFYPRYITTTNCSKKLCTENRECKKNVYDLIVLKKKANPDEISIISVPLELKRHWIASKIPVTVGCTCVGDYKKKEVGSGF